MWQIGDYSYIITSQQKRNKKKNNAHNFLTMRYEKIQNVTLHQTD